MVKIPHLIRPIPILPRMRVMIEPNLVIFCPDFPQMQRNDGVLSTIPLPRPAGNGLAMTTMATMTLSTNTLVGVIVIRQTQGSVAASSVEITPALPNWIHINFNSRPSRYFVMMCTKFFSQKVPLIMYSTPSHHQNHSHHSFVSFFIANTACALDQIVSNSFSTAFFFCTTNKLPDIIYLITASAVP